MNVVWLTSSPITTENGRKTALLASARYRVLIPAEQLESSGVHSTVIGKDELESDNVVIPADTDIVVISKASHEAIEIAAKRAKRDGKAIIVDFCDDNFLLGDIGPFHKGLAALADTIVAGTPQLADAIKMHTGRTAAIINDPCEGPRGTPRFAPRDDELKLLWFGHQSNASMLYDVLPDLRILASQFRIRLTLVSLFRQSVMDNFQPYFDDRASPLQLSLTDWSLPATWQALEECDMVIIPSDDSSKNLSKGPNRVFESLWAGRCVAAYPLPSYKEFAAWAYLDEDICSAIERALDERGKVVARVAAAQDYIAEHYSPRAMTAKWLDVLRQTLAVPRQPYSAAPAETAAHKPTLRLNLGCGDKRLPGYVNVDVADERLGITPDVICDIRKLTAFETDTADEILSVHVVEHLWRWEVVDVLRDWVRALKPGGKMILECPNLKSACEEFLRNPRQASGPGPESQRSMWVFYGDPRWRDPLMVHRWGYTPESLADVMHEAGLTNIRQEPAQFKLREPRDMRIVGEKPRAQG